MRYTLSVLLDIEFYINQGYGHYSFKDQRGHIELIVLKIQMISDCKHTFENTFLVANYIAKA